MTGLNVIDEKGRRDRRAPLPHRIQHRVLPLKRIAAIVSRGKETSIIHKKEREVLAGRELKTGIPVSPPIHSVEIDPGYEIADGLKREVRHQIHGCVPCVAVVTDFQGGLHKRRPFTFVLQRRAAALRYRSPRA